MIQDGAPMKRARRHNRSVRRLRQGDEMTAAVGQWRVTYAPGDSLVLAGPTSLVLLNEPETANVELDRPLSRADLETRHQWNTYVIDGLPPTPIANPGRGALEATLKPAESDELYFVADGSGGHVFAKTLAEHNRNVARLRAVERSRGGNGQ